MQCKVYIFCIANQEEKAIQMVLKPLFQAVQEDILIFKLRIYVDLNVYISQT
jgi:hypothetical protein